MLIKATLNRSNPQIMREIEINNDKTIDDLLNSILIGFGLPRDTSIRLTHGTVGVGEKSKIGDILKIDANVNYTAHAEIKAPVSRYYYQAKDDEWLIRLDLEEGDFEDISIVAYRGINIPGEITTLKDLNRIHYIMDTNGSFSDYQYGVLRKENFYSRGSF